MFFRYRNIKGEIDGVNRVRYQSARVRNGRSIKSQQYGCKIMLRQWNK